MFHSPGFLLLLLLLPLFAWRMFAKRNSSAVAFTSVAMLGELAPTLRQRLLWLPKVLVLASLFFLIISLARPREGREQTTIDSEGIAIQMVVDRSSSMQAMDFQIDGKSVDRLTAVKNVAGKFVTGERNLAGRFSDLVGLITFAGFADGITPPTLDHQFLVANLNRTEIVRVRGEDGTAIGDAIALAVEKLNALDDRQEEKIKSKVVILLTDGENTAGELDPVAAADLASTMDIRIYTIGVGTRGQAPIPVQDPFSGRSVLRMMPVNIDEETLQQVADRTGGKYFRATDTDSLTAIYREIDELEKTKVETENFTDFRELAVKSWRTRLITVPPILSISMVLLLAGVTLQHTWLREVI